MKSHSRTDKKACRDSLSYAQEILVVPGRQYKRKVSIVSVLWIAKQERYRFKVSTQTLLLALVIRQGSERN